MVKEMKMKKNLVFAGLTSVLLAAGLMFTACPTEGGSGGGLNPENLPVLPNGVTYVTTDTEAKALLSALRPGFSAAREDINKLIQNALEEEEGNVTWSIADEISIENLKINSLGRSVIKENLSKVEDVDDLTGLIGSTLIEGSQNENTTVVFTGDKALSGATVYQGSKTVERASASYKATLKSISLKDMAIIVNINGSGQSSQEYGLTASSNGKGGKIILEAAARFSLKGDFDITDIMGTDGPDMSGVSPTISGFLKVYGADNAVVYELPIINQESYVEALGYFGNNEII
jgi:hypothetical protein